MRLENKDLDMYQKKPFDEKRKIQETNYVLSKTNEMTSPASEDVDLNSVYEAMERGLNQFKNLKTGANQLLSNTASYSANDALPNNSWSLEAHYILEDNHIYIDGDVNIAMQEDYGDGYWIALENGYELDVLKNDRSVLINRMDTSGVDQITINADGYDVTAGTSTWEITPGEVNVTFQNGKQMSMDMDLNTFASPLRCAEDFSLGDLRYFSNDAKGNLDYNNTAEDIHCVFKSDGLLTSFSNKDVTINYDYNATSKDMQVNIYGQNMSMLDLMHIDQDASINYIATANINGHEMKYYSIGEQYNINTSYPVMSSLQYSNYSDSILSTLTNKDNKFWGTIIAPRSYAQKGEGDTSWAAYAKNNAEYRYIFAPDTTNNNYEALPLHEMGHVLHYIYNGNRQMNSQELNTLYNQYQSVVPTLSSSGYCPSNGHSTSPDTYEFFADASANYFLNPDEVARYAPDLYNYLKSIYS